MRRILAAMALLPPLLVVVLFLPAWAFLVLAELVALLGIHELFGMMEERGYRPLRRTGYLGTALVVGAFHPSLNRVVEALVLATLAIGLAAIARGAPRSESLGEIAGTVLGTAYAGLLTGCIVAIRWVPNDLAGRNWILFLLSVVILGDTGAYYVGRALGRRTLAPTISPKKTVEGMVGGLALAAIAAVLASGWLGLALGWSRALILGLALGGLGVAGDLFESLLKRSVRRKDASMLIPGHGGILDRLDSLLFAGPGLLLYLELTGAA